MNVQPVRISSNVSFSGNGFFKNLSQRIQNSPTMLKVKNVSPFTIAIGAAVVALGAFAAAFASKAGGKPAFSPLKVVNIQGDSPSAALTSTPKINLLA